jgi:hypothetical protein
MKKGLIIAASILIIGALLTWIITAPTKSLEISVLWTPPYPEFPEGGASYDALLHERESIVYRVYYVWDDERHPLPWWIITDSLDGQWRAIEAANSDTYTTRPESNALFEDAWIEGSFSSVQRTRVQLIQHIVFGTNHAFSEEIEALRRVKALIGVEDEFKRQGRDLFDSMAEYMESHPEYGSFWPPSRDYFDDQFARIRDEYLTKQSNEE